MKIQHNIMAMNAYRNLGMNNSKLSKNLEKLSSGYRINRAGDDAAGLAISEKMRAQIAGLDQAQKNAQSGINLVQTAEGALTEVHSMLNRMVTLATQAANGTYNTEDQQKIQSEIDALTEEIERISDNSNFNGTKLLDGNLAGVKVTQTAGTSTTTPAKNAVKAAFTVTLDTGNITVADGKKLTIGNKDLATASGSDLTGTGLDTAIKTTIGTGLDVTIDGVAYTATTADGKVINFVQKQDPTADGKTGTTFTDAIQAAITNGGTAVPDANAAISAVTEGKKAVAESTTGTAAKTEIDFTGKTGADIIGGKLEIGTAKFQFVETAGDGETGYTEVVVGKNDDATAIGAALAAKVTAAGDYKAAAAAAGKVTIEEANTTDGAIAADLTVKQEGLGGMTLQIGADAVETITVSVDSMSAASLGIDKASMNVGDVKSANAALDTINAAIEKVSVQRGDLGAVQNRLEHTINNLGVMEENIQDAEANIRDTDIADEMMAYTKNNILIQSAQAMLAQANQVPQGVLQLMQ